MPVNRLLRTFIFVFVLFSLPFTAYGQDDTLNILYTGAIKGELEPCGCSPKNESGGIARLSGYIAVNKAGLIPYILIDAGNSTPGDSEQSRLKAEALMNSFGVIGYDAAAFLKDESLPDAFLSPLVKRYGIRAVSDNGRYKDSVLIERGQININISADEKGYKKGLVNILLTAKPVSEANTIKGWDVIATSSGEILEEPVMSGKTIIVSGAPKNRRLGILTVGIGTDGTISKVAHRWQSLDKDIKEDPVVRKIINDYDDKVALLVKENEKKASVSGPYLSVLNCTECHQPFVDYWKTTKHSGAFNDLEKAGKSKDPECVRCHTTGYGEEGGFYSFVSTPNLINVQCEACHGPGKGHAADFSISMRPIAEGVCRRCHTKDNSPDFDFETYFKKIKHQ